jgi:hypothetical protein
MADKSPRPEEDLSQLANQPQAGLAREFWDFLLHYKKWWLTPIIVILLLMGVLVFLAGTPIAPFVYPF